jgi:hypothetical protein
MAARTSKTPTSEASVARSAPRLRRTRCARRGGGEARPGQAQAGAGGRQFGKAGLDEGRGARLPVDVEAGGARLCDQQRALAVRALPYAVVEHKHRCAAQARGDAPEFPRGVRGQAAPGQQTERRGEQFELFLQG